MLNLLFFEDSSLLSHYCGGWALVAWARVVSIDKGIFMGQDCMVLYTGYAAMRSRLKEMIYVQHVLSISYTV